MNRREFLKGLSLLPVIAVVPLTFKPETVEPEITSPCEIWEKLGRDMVENMVKGIEAIPEPIMGIESATGKLVIKYPGSDRFVEYVE